ncbi:MAG: recombination mediator RecR [Coriobacteriales bacterium]|nr:recombination mediator RecR [Coriobacteriaceae bacterium]MDD7202810.1 recombination mediator RecR [Coriobacteriaceae bacterium]MDY2723347.1 recombination mediator RecR [Coriobacteriales bacterium]MDY5662145.1 recombination mediator RecR [Coriobacteriales bacterium]
MKQAASIRHALEELERMPGVGPKSAQRILNWILTSDDETAHRLAEAIIEVKEAIHLCPRCHNYAEGDECEVCLDPERDTTSICVVAEPRDIDAIERTGSYHGLYHVLGGVINPMEGSLPQDLHIADLMARLGSENIQEVLIATNPDVEGETTASYLARIIKPLDIKVTRLASGLPVGGELEYADEVTLGRAIESRRLL